MNIASLWSTRSLSGFCALAPLTNLRGSVPSFPYIYDILTRFVDDSSPLFWARQRLSVVTLLYTLPRSSAAAVTTAAYTTIKRAITGEKGECLAADDGNSGIKTKPKPGRRRRESRRRERQQWARWRARRAGNARGCVLPSYPSYSCAR
jgi:hypothetical protein